MNAAQKTLVGLGTAGAVAVGAMLATKVTPTKIAAKIGLATVSTSALGYADACSSQGNITEAVMVWTFTLPAGVVTATWPRGVCKGYVVPLGTTAFALDITYPGGYVAHADGAIAFMTPAPTATVTPTWTPRPTKIPVTPTPCLDSDHPYGMLRQVAWWYECWNCVGQKIGVPDARNVCGPSATPTKTLPATPTAAPTGTRVGSLGRTRRPPITMQFRAPLGPPIPTRTPTP